MTIQKRIRIRERNEIHKIMNYTIYTVILIYRLKTQWNENENEMEWYLHRCHLNSSSNYTISLEMNKG